MPILPLAILSVGLLLVAFGGDLFVRGALGISRWARIAPAVVGATVAAFATSSPELTVAVSAAAAGAPEIALGDALGSNIVNVALILAISALIAPVKQSRDTQRREFAFAVCAPILTLLLLIDGQLSRVDGMVLLCSFAIWFGLLLRAVRRQRAEASAEALSKGKAIILVQSSMGLLLLIWGGYWIVTGAKEFAEFYGIDPFIIGVTLVALGTSAPELATVIVAKLRGHDQLGLGALLGSNIFNGTAIVGIAALIHPIEVHWVEVSFALAVGVVAILAAMPWRSDQIGRHRGVILLAVYLTYLSVQFQRGAV